MDDISSRKVSRRIRHREMVREYRAAQTREARAEGIPPVRLDPCVRDPESYEPRYKVEKAEILSPRKKRRMIIRRFCKQSRQLEKMCGVDLLTDAQVQLLDILSTVG